MRKTVFGFVASLAVLTVLGAMSIIFERWEFINNVIAYPHEPPARLVISMSTFSTRIQVTAIDAIQHLLTHQLFDRLIVTVSMDHRKEKGTCLFPGECVSDEGIQPASTVQECLELFERAFGTFVKIQDPEAGYHAFVTPKIYLQIMTVPDYGPATKLLGALRLETDPETVIVTVDDDSFYFPNYIPLLAARLPSDGVLGVMFQDLDSNKNPFIINTPVALRVLYEGHGVQVQSWLMGVTAIAYRVRYFKPDIMQEARNLSRECFLNDDVWIGGYLKRHGIKRYSYFGPSLYKHVRHATESLSSIPGAQDRDISVCAQSYGF